MGIGERLAEAGSWWREGRYRVTSRATRGARRYPNYLSRTLNNEQAEPYGVYSAEKIITVAFPRHAIAVRLRGPAVIGDCVKASYPAL